VIRGIVRCMHGVPLDLPLARFIGRDLNPIVLGRFQVQFHFLPVGHIAVEGRWVLRDPAGALVDEAQEHAIRDCYRIHRVLDVPVARYEIDPPRSFTLLFESGHRLSVFDDTPQYESFSIHIDGEPTIYV
jgi:hypothetical protein